MRLKRIIGDTLIGIAKGAWALFLTNVIKQTTFSVDIIKLSRTSEKKDSSHTFGMTIQT
jgi:hypothetical protein